MCLKDVSIIELNLDPFRQSKKEFVESVIETCKPFSMMHLALIFPKTIALKSPFVLLKIALLSMRIFAHTSSHFT